MTKNSLSLVSANTVTLAAGSRPYGAVGSPDGKNLYVVLNGSTALAQYAVDSTTGALSPIAGQPATLPVTNSPRRITMSPDGKHVYVVATGYSEVHVFSRDATTGALTAVTPNPSSTNFNSPIAIAISSDGKHAYITSASNAKLVLFSRDSTTGKLTPLSTATVDLSGGPTGVAVSPDGTGVYVTCSTALLAFNRDPATGLLVPATTASYAFPYSAGSDVKVSADSQYVYACGGNDDGYLKCYSRNAATNELSALAAPTRTDGGRDQYPWMLALSTDGSVLYLSQGGAAKVSVYDRAANGTLVLRQVTATAGGNNTYGLAILATSNFAYTTDYSATISVMAVEAAPAADVTPPSLTGSVTVTAVSTTGATASWPAATDAMGVTGYKYSLNGGTSWVDVGNVTTKAITGLTPSTAYTIQVVAYDAAGNQSTPAITGNFTTTAVVADTTAPVLSNGTATAASSTAATATVITDDGTGTLYYFASANAVETAAAIKAASSKPVTASGTQAISFTGLQASSTYYGHFVQVDPSGNTSNVINTASFTTQAAPVLPAGALNLKSSVQAPAGCGLFGLTASPDSKNVYAVMNTGSFGVLQYAVDPATGALSQIPGKPASVATAGNPRWVAVTPDGKHLYCVVTGNSRITAFTRNITDGSLTLIGDVSDTNIATPNGIGISPDGAHVYVTMRDSGKLVTYARNATTGVLTLMGTPAVMATGSNAQGVKVTPDGTGVFAVCANSVYCYTRDPATGALTPAATPTITTPSAFPNAIEISDDSAFVYVACDSGGQFTGCFSRNKSTNVLTDIGHPAQTSDNNGGPWGIALSKDIGNTSLYLAISDAQKITQYDRNTGTGALTFKTPGFVGTSNYTGVIQGSKGPYAVTVLPNNSFLYSTDSGNDMVTTFEIIGAGGSGGSGGVTPAPTGTITSQPAPNGQSQRFVGTTTNATNGMATLVSTSGGANVGPTAFTVTNNTFDFTLTGIPAGAYTPTLTVTGPGGGPATVTGTVAISILGIDGSGELPLDNAAPVLTGTLAVTSITTTGFTMSCAVATDDVDVAGYEYSIDNGTSWISNGTSTIATVSGLSPATDYQLSMRAFDAAGLRSSEVTASVTTLAVAAPVPTVTGVTVTPAAITLNADASYQFAAAVVGTNNPSQGVTWAASHGTISSTGLFQAPSATSENQVITITATSQLDTSKVGAAAVTVPASSVIVVPPEPSVTSVAVTPNTLQIQGGGSVAFSAAVTGTGNPNLQVAWQASAGTIDQTGLFTAPATSNTVQVITVTATSLQDSTKTGHATVTVLALPVVVDPSRTVAVTVLAMDQQGNAMAGAYIRATLSAVDVDAVNGFVVPEELTATADSEGHAVLHLWPNTLGNGNSYYVVVIENPDTGDELAVKVTVPNQDCQLHEVGTLMLNQ